MIFFNKNYHKGIRQLFLTYNFKFCFAVGVYDIHVCRIRMCTHKLIMQQEAIDSRSLEDKTTGRSAKGNIYMIYQDIRKNDT